MRCTDKHPWEKGGVSTPPFFSWPAISLLASILASVIFHYITIYGLSKYLLAIQVATTTQQGAKEIALVISDGEKNQQVASAVRQEQNSSSLESPPNFLPPASTEQFITIGTPSYLPTRELETPPRAVEFFNFSSLALPKTASGKVIITLWINTEGTVDFLEVEQTNVPDELVRSIIAQRKNLVFTPGSLHGSVVGSIIKYELTLASSNLQQRNKQAINP